MVFYTDIVIEFVCFLTGEGPVPFNIKVAAFTKTATANPAGKISVRCLQVKFIILKIHFIYFAIFEEGYFVFNGNFF